MAPLSAMLSGIFGRFWPDDLKINRCHLLVTLNLHVKFEGHGCRQCGVITLRSFLCSRSLWPWPLTQLPQNQEGSSTGKAQPQSQVWGLKLQALFSYHSDKLGHCDLDLSHDDLTIGIIYWSPPAFMLSFRVMDACNVELSLGKTFAFKVLTWRSLNQ